jgi:hypothetical protein
MLGHNVLNEGKPIKSLMDCFYFSIVTATTLGYGDLVPSDSVTKLLSMLEVSFGAIFITAVLTVALAFRHTPSELTR